MSKTNQETLKHNLNLWQEYAQTYTDFAFEATEQTLQQSLALRERFGSLLGGAYKQVEALSIREQDTVLQAIEDGQARTQAATKRVAGLFKTPSTN